MVRITNITNNKKIFVILTIATIFTSAIGISLSTQRLLGKDTAVRKDRHWQTAEKDFDRNLLVLLARQYVRFDENLTEDAAISSMTSFPITSKLYLIRFERSEMCGMRGCLHLIFDTETEGVTPLQIASKRDLPIELNQNNKCLFVLDAIETTNLCATYERNKLVYKPQQR